MTDIRIKYEAPSISLTAFNCPHCGALAKQFWFSAHADQLAKDALPFRPTPEVASVENFEKIEDAKERAGLKRWITRLASGEPFLDSNSNYRNFDVYNVSFSKCFNCNKTAIWIHNNLVFPVAGAAPIANADIPVDARRDYDEASSILELSPRGSAALLRLAIQKLCKELGEKGKNIDDDIASLVKKGLDVRVQQALDVVRVIGNNAVHPGQIDLRDDRSTAEKLFGLVNLIAEIMIGQPKHIAAMFDGLPESSRNAIAKRDGKASPRTE